MNFIIDLSSSKREDVIYNVILVIINECTEMIKYLLMIVKIDVAKLTKLFYVSIYQQILLVIETLYLLMFFDQRFVIIQRLNVD